VKAEDFVGTYRGRGQDQVTRDGTVSNLTSGGEGRLVYTADGTVMVISTRTARKPLPASVSGNDLSGATMEEKATTAEGVVAYAGHYEVKGEQVLHHVEVSFFPNWVGTTNVRKFQWQGKLLILSTPPDAQGTVRRIHWEKMTGGGKR
jgi:hypothetical protein